MRKVVVGVFLIMLMAVTMTATAQENDRPMSVGLWVVVQDEGFARRVFNATVEALESSEDWLFEVQPGEWDTDVHVIINGMPVVGTRIYAWSVTFTPIFAPHYTNGVVATSDADMSGMNWLAQNAAQYVIDQLYYWYDDQQERQSQPSAYNDDNT